MTDSIKYKNKEYKCRIIFDSQKAEKEENEYFRKAEIFEAESKHFERSKWIIFSVLLAVFIMCAIIGIWTNNGTWYWTTYGLSAAFSFGVAIFFAVRAYNKVQKMDPGYPSSNINFLKDTRGKTIVKAKFDFNKVIPIGTIWVDLTLCDANGIISKESYLKNFKEKKDLDEIILDFDTGVVTVPWIPEDN